MTPYLEQPLEQRQDGACDFAATVAFVNRLVELADRLGHHPD
ncbi:MAG TPA: hypothetical protein VEZ50_05980 [Nodosilinea sp.]|nr:hypothetical protein [Nodosilinea sp.]